MMDDKTYEEKKKELWEMKDHITEKGKEEGLKYLQLPKPFRKKYEALRAEMKQEMEERMEKSGVEVPEGQNIGKAVNSQAEKEPVQEGGGDAAADNDMLQVSKKELAEIVARAVALNMGRRAEGEELPTQTMLGNKDGWEAYNKPKKENKRARLHIWREDETSEPAIVVDIRYKKLGFNEETRQNDIPLCDIDVVRSTEAGIVDLKDVVETVKDVDLRTVLGRKEWETVELIKMTEVPKRKLLGKGVTPPRSRDGAILSRMANLPMEAKAYLGAGEEFQYAVWSKDFDCVAKRECGMIFSIDSTKLNN